MAVSTEGEVEIVHQRCFGAQNTLWEGASANGFSTTHKLSKQFSCMLDERRTWQADGECDLVRVTLYQFNQACLNELTTGCAFVNQSVMFSFLTDRSTVATAPVSFFSTAFTYHCRMAQCTLLSPLLATSIAIITPHSVP